MSSPSRRGPAVSSSGYVYAVLNAPDYRARYADGLRYLFPRVPIARDPGTFDQIRKIAPNSSPFTSSSKCRRPSASTSMPSWLRRLRSPAAMLASRCLVSKVVSSIQSGAK